MVGPNVETEAQAPTRDVRERLGADGALVVGYFGHLDFTRGVDLLFESVRRLRRTADVRLVMIGAGGEERYSEYRQLATAYGIAEATTWTGYLPSKEVANVLANIDVCVLPYRRNSLGRSALAAALTVGVPTVLAGTPAGIAPLEGGRHVELVPRDDVAALWRRCAVWAPDADARARLARGAPRCRAVLCLAADSRPGAGGLRSRPPTSPPPRS